ncbi:hypothetical protein, partial [Heyndrickxia coagulans]|uniref:hypothetical protein n=1 Tax=Heyndrickxia coagulans TaxID=1398 RepID=UPI00214D7C3A
SQQQTLFETDQLVSPLLPNVDNPVNPVVPNVINPDPLPLYHYASNKLRASIGASIRVLMQRHNFPLPQNWTYEQLADEIIGQPVDLVHLVEIMKDITTYGFASQAFHQVLDFLHTMAPPAAAVLGS